MGPGALAHAGDHGPLAYPVSPARTDGAERAGDGDPGSQILDPRMGGRPEALAWPSPCAGCEQNNLRRAIARVSPHADGHAEPYRISLPWHATCSR